MTARPVRALVVEDDSSWRQILSEILSDMDILVDDASNLEEALHSLKATSHRLAVVDLSLEKDDHLNSDGLRVLTALRYSDPDCRTILLTGFATVELAVSVLTDYGAFTFLRKETFQRSQFRETVQRALASLTTAEKETEILKASSHLQRTNTGGEPGQGGKALVVEDDAGWRNILAELLADLGHEVRSCASYGDALGSLRREKFLLAVIDLSLAESPAWPQAHSMNQLEGFRLLAETKSAHIPTVVVSGIVSMDEIQQAYKEYAIFAYLEKQAFDRATFKRLVTEAALSSSGISEMAGLTPRQKEVFDLMAKGMTNKAIAQALVVTPNTVKRHLKSIFEKLDVHTRSAAVSKALSNSLDQ